MGGFWEQQSLGIFTAGAFAGAVVACGILLRRKRRPGGVVDAAYKHIKGRTDLIKGFGAYPQNHWSREAMPATDAKRFIAVLEVSDGDGDKHQVLVLLKSAEGYTTVCALTDRADPISMMNRVPTQQQYEAVSLAASQVAAAFLRLGVYPQMELLGNNSHTFNDATGQLELGNEKEPFTPHFHVTGRGDPKHEYIAGVPLRGLRPYTVMVPRARTEAWGSQEEPALVAAGLARSLEQVALHPAVRIVERKVSV
eukprot:Hpha_TRINITY_DN31102_c0_g1::TRINITY_DN31102_c0_g1_i1::g.33099::m.33099